MHGNCPHDKAGTRDGPHHNENYPDDVDKLVDQFLLMLKRHGHNLRRASITTGVIQEYKNLPEIS